MYCGGSRRFDLKVRFLGGHRINKYVLTTAAVFFSAFLQAFSMKTFLNAVNLLPGGFTGLAILLEQVTGLFGIHFSTSVGMILLNIPVAVFCYRHVGKKFVLFSMLQVFLASALLKVLPENYLFDDILLNICFGGFLYGISIVMALKGNASTGGMDFVALYISNRIGKSIWQYVFIFNCVMLCVFGAVFGWEHAGYSIMFQFVSTQTIERFYHRYKRVTLQITTEHPKELTAAYIGVCKHGISVMDGYGGYSRKPMSLLHTVVSAYEVQDLVDCLRQADKRVTINVIPTESFFGIFYQKPME